MGRSRARTDDAKRARRQFILVAAEQLLRLNGFDAFTMNKLAAAADLDKGTLYIYFARREELVLTLYTDLHDSWINRFIDAEKKMETPDYDALCARFYHSFVADALLVDLAARVMSGLEPYVPLASWVKAKQAQMRSAKRFGGMLCYIFGYDQVQAQRLAWAFFAGLSGAQQRAIDVDSRFDMPADLQKLSVVVTSREVFLNMVLPLAPYASYQNSPIMTLSK